MPYNYSDDFKTKMEAFFKTGVLYGFNWKDGYCASTRPLYAVNDRMPVFSNDFKMYGIDIDFLFKGAKGHIKYENPNPLNVEDWAIDFLTAISNQHA